MWYIICDCGVRSQRKKRDVPGKQCNIHGKQSGVPVIKYDIFGKLLLINIRKILLQKSYTPPYSMNASKLFF